VGACARLPEIWYLFGIFFDVKITVCPAYLPASKACDLDSRE
jgi:hypothetical protein